MKTNKILALALGLVSMLFVNSCVEDDDYSVPEVLVPAVDFSTLGTKTTFASVISRYNDAVADGDNVGTWEFDAPLYIEGYVVSSDAAGNFFEEIIIQNSPDENDLSDDPRRGLKVEINVRDLGNFYNYGRKVYVKLNGLAVGESNGVITLGREDGSNLGQIEPFEYEDFVIRDPEVFTLSPKVVAIADLTPEDENTLVQFSNAQFAKSAVENTNTYAGEDTDQFDGFRTIEGCDSGSTILLQTSTFADFKSFPLAPGRGTITGVYSRDFGDDFSVLIVNDTDAIDFSNSDRCDPDVLECTGPSGGGTTIFSENFEGFGSYTAEGWTNVNISGTNTDWFISGFNNNDYSRISAFSSGNAEAKVWLVTPAIDLDNTTEEELSFQIEAAYDNGTILSVYVSNDFTGDPTTATWQLLDASIPVGPSGGFGGLQDVDPINISCLDGSINIGFFYEGSDPAATTRYHLDNFEVTGKL